MDYAQYYGFSRMPFGEDADREAFFRAETYKEALALVLYGIRERKGYIVVSGEQGMGKTTLVRQAVSQLDERTRAALISTSHDQYYPLLKELMEKLGLSVKGASKGSMLHELYEFLIRCLKEGKNIVIFLDDAHRMKDEIIEELRLLSNLETSRTKLVQIVVVGEPELLHRLNSKHLRQIRQRIQILHHLLPLGRDESLQYVEHRLARAGRSGADVFTPEALAALCKYAGGSPRNLNTLCDGALALGAERSEKPVSAGTVGDARKAAGPLLRAGSPSVSAGGVKSVLRSPWIYAAAAAAAAGIFLGSQYMGSHLPEPRHGVALVTAVVQPVPDRKAAEAGGATATLPAKEPQQTGVPAGSQETPPASLAAPAAGSAAQEADDTKPPAKEIAVREGATLSSIAVRHYGFVNTTLLDEILELNPGITDVDLVRTGGQVFLPQTTGKARLVRRGDGSIGVHAATFLSYREARDYAGKLDPNLAPVDIVKRRVAPGKDWYRVVVGAFANRQEARKAFEGLVR